MEHRLKGDYKVVHFVDVNELLGCAKKEFSELDQQIKEEERVEKELREFIKHVEKHSGHKIHHIGNSKDFGVFMVKFLFKKGGFMEVIGERPLTLKAHFINKKDADMFAKGLKKALHNLLPETPVKDMVIDSIAVEDGFKEEQISVGKWKKMNKLLLHKTAIVTVFVFILVTINEFWKEILKVTTLETFGLHSLVTSVVMAVVIAFLFDPIKNKIEHLLEKWF